LSSVLSAALRSVSREVLWELVVCYYNETEAGEINDTDQPPAIVQQHGIDHLHFEGLQRLAFLLLTMTGGFRLNVETVDLSDPNESQSKEIRSAAADLHKSLREFQEAVKWLCTPKNTKSTGFAARLRKLATSKKFGWENMGRYPLIDKKNELFVQYFENHGLKHFRIHPTLEGGQHGSPVRLELRPRCRHFVDLFCAFFLAECSGKTPSEMPVKLCRLCGKLFPSQQRKAEFCSRNCQWRNYWTPKRKRDDKFIKDLQKFAETCKPEYGRSIKNLRAKLTADRERLDEIKRAWKDWPTILDRIHSIEALAK
jgi:hypothetical protein